MTDTIKITNSQGQEEEYIEVDKIEWATLDNDSTLILMFDNSNGTHHFKKLQSKEEKEDE